jgi:hypothetical protein
MFNISTLKTALTGYIGFRNPDDTTIGSIATALRSSVSGQYMDDVSPLLRTDNLWYAAPEETTFSTWLLNKYNASIVKLFNRLATEKKLSGSTKSIFDNLPLFDGAGLISDQITKSGRLVGIAIATNKINNIQLVINQVGLQLTTAQTGLPIYLWHSSSVGTCDSKVLVTSGTDSFTWNKLDFELDYMSYAKNIDSGGTWYIGYFENDLAGNAIHKRYDFFSGPCIGCANSSYLNITRFNLWSTYFKASPFSVDASKLSGTNLPSIKDMTYDITNNYGLNLAITVRPDITDIITSNLSIITYPLGLQFANDMLEWMAYNPAVRINPSRVNATQAAILYELSGSVNTKSDGIKIELAKAITALAEDLSKISVALPQNKPSGIKIGAI